MRICIIVIFSLSVSTAFGQEEINLDELSDSFILSDDADSDDGSHLENMTQIFAHRLDLNKMDGEQLRSLNVLTHIQINALLAHREKHGKLFSIYELQSVDGFDIETIHKLQRLAVVKEVSERIDRSLLSRMRSEGETYLMLRYEHQQEQRKGFSSEAGENLRFLGSPGRVSVRARSYKPGDFSVGITAEKDPGEQFKWNMKNSQYYFDYTSFHLQVQNKGQIKNLIIGDFQSQFGQGLIWGGGMGFGKGAETIANCRRTNLGFLPYTSAYEAGNLRGLASTIAISRHLTLSSAYSFAMRDATIQDDFDGESASSFQYSGLHRNINELARRKTVEENIMGTALEYSKKSLTVGTTFQHVGLNTPLEPRKLIYNQFNFRGNVLNNVGLFANYNYNNVALFGEFAKTLSAGTALVVGSLISLSRRLDVSFVYRHYDSDFHTLYGNAFSENTKPQNERGAYWGWKYRYSRKFQWSGYVDMFRFPWLKFRTYSPSQGNEWLVRFQWQPSKNHSLYIQARQENKWRNIATPLNLYQLGKLSKHNYWLNIDYMLTPAIKMKSRLQYSNQSLNGNFTEGITLLHDISFQLNRLKCTLRYALFDTDDYDNRQYVYENDVWLAYALPAYYGEGVRKYVLLQYKVNKHLTCWVKYSQTRYSNRETIGSGADMIDGSEQNDIKFELRLKL